MKKAIKFGINNIEYTIKIQNKPTPSNFDKSVSVYKGKEKCPLFGTVFKHETTQYEILIWAKKYAENLLKNPVSIF